MRRPNDKASAPRLTRIRRLLKSTGLVYLYRILRRPGDVRAAARFALAENPGAPRRRRIRLALQSYLISERLDCPHSQAEALACMDSILRIPPAVQGCVVEAGCYKGGSTAKFSLAAQLARRPLFVFDSFEGIPPNDEMHERDIFGAHVRFAEGAYKGALQEVEANLERYGDIDSCVLVKGWFEQTLPKFKDPIAVAYVDVDLASSTSTCLKYLYPLLVPGGVLYSQDGHLPLVLEVFRDKRFWEKEVGCVQPHIDGMGTSKLLKIVKPNSNNLVPADG
jgi:O-methyltransferase